MYTENYFTNPFNVNLSRFLNGAYVSVRDFDAMTGSCDADVLKPTTSIELETAGRIKCS